MSTANRTRARQRTSEVKKYLTLRTNRCRITRSKVTGCSLIHDLASGGLQPLAGEPGPAEGRNYLAFFTNPLRLEFVPLVYQ